ncbi:hydrogenase (NiFe) small subunit HydA [Ferrimonas balearica DSM 9799]|uniref:hydrogenase (acceptor) n=3 Tax=Ferrimonas balearica TaxID=44012 RepID=E1SV42_FERBD|nr:hydrogenase small subunit [Ferrimonas balearica]ADN77342.1 hydrogenase (NiFe) small subunit HydA [Ferrimonas balearica DSM 9799]MBY5980444.1 hydrogenase small subunit [Ferrimonas balearica]MBY6224220.1 hydrogenase small subunit [Ferrimonas balearica]
MSDYQALMARCEARLEKLAAQAPVKTDSLQTRLDAAGISRRDFMKWSAVTTTALALPMQFAPMVAKAAEVADRVPLIWLHMAECTGCSESLIRCDTPTIDTVLFDHISLEYHETLMAAAGWQAEENLEHALHAYKGQYLLAVEGAIPTANGGHFLTVGCKGHTGMEIIHETAANAAAIISVGTCAAFGGVQAAAPNPTEARPVDKVIHQPVVNLGGCPPSEKNIVGTLMYFIMFGKLPPLDMFNRPKWAYGARVHDNCERRGRFDAGEFVETFGDHGAKEGYCLYKVGCKGPYTYNNCPTERFNHHTSWPVLAGHGCIGCSEPNFWDTMADFEKPLGRRELHSLDKTADFIGGAILGLTVAGIGAHAVASVFAKENKEEEQ